MATRLNGDTLRWLDTLNHEGSFAEMSDGQLLERFLARTGAASEAAFEVLVRRHGPMVLSRCRGVLHDDHAAADAFQATFLVLARRAATIRKCDHLAPWLGRVARRIARRSRAEEARRAARERRITVNDSRAGNAVVDFDEREQAALIREEINRLPRMDRLLLRLTYWRGKTYEEAATLLSWPIGTVRSRLSRARDRLRGRLTRRGLAPVLAVTGPAAMVSEASAARPPEALVVQTVRAATLSAGQMTAAVKAGAISATVAALANGELSMMTAIFGKSIGGLVLLGGLTTAGVVLQAQRGSDDHLVARGHELEAAGPTARPVSPEPQPVDREAWARKLAGLNEADWRTAFAIGEELAALPADEGFAILTANWKKIEKVDSRQQLLKAWQFAHHPRLVDGLDLGMRDQSPDVQRWAASYLNFLAFQDFSEDFQAYQDWYRANRDQPLPEVVARSARRFADEAARSVKSDAGKRARWLAMYVSVLGDMPEARLAMLDAGLLRTLERWASGATTRSQREEIERVANALSVFGQLKPGEAELKRVMVPLLAKEKPVEVRAAAIRALEGQENAWAIDLLLDVLKNSLEEDRGSRGTIVWAAAATLASIDNPRVIPPMIAVIDADNTEDTVYGVGYFGLGRLTGVEYDKSHDGAWWRQWWEKNKGRYAGVARAFEAPKTSETRPRAEQAADDPLADVADVPAQDLRAGGDDKKRYFLIGAKEAKPPAAGYGLLIVLPGGDGSAEFQPFIRRIYKNALNDRWLIAQAVAPKWDANQFNRIVWPTATSRYPAARFTTEEFIQAIVGDVRAKVKVNPRRVVLLGWSSGGPPCYAAALNKDPVVTGAFIAMSIFRPAQLPALENAKDRPFYLLQSPQDQVTPVRQAEAAENALQAAGAKVRLQRYEGGHGWRGNVWAMIGDGIAWLDQQLGTE